MPMEFNESSDELIELKGDSEQDSNELFQDDSEVEEEDFDIED